MNLNPTPLVFRHPALGRGPAAPLLELQARIHQEARAAGQPVQHLLPLLLDRRNLEAAWDRVSTADGANTPGPDGVTCNELRDRAGPWLARLADDLYHRRYRPVPPRLLDVPKAHRPGAFRRLGIPTVRDRVVHAALKQVLEPILDDAFLHGSFGFRPGRSVPGALAEALRLLDAPRPGDPGAPAFTHGLHLDVADCFDTVDHGLLAEELGRHVADPELLRLLGLVLDAGGTRCGRLWWQRTCGLVQGSPLSPLLCNLYLHPLDQALADLARASGDGARALRYADDLLLLGRDARQAERAAALTRQVLRRLHQRPRDPAAVPVPLEAGLDWLGVRLRPRPQRWGGRLTHGYVVPDARVVEMLGRLDEMTAPPSARVDGAAFNPAKWIVSISDQLRDWRQAYVYADNAPEVFRALDDHARARVGLLLQSITGARGPELLRRYRVRLPRGFWTWEVPGARLTVLSSLAPQAPANLTRRPAWTQRHLVGRPVAVAPHERNGRRDAPPAARAALPPPAVPALPAPTPAAPAQAPLGGAARKEVS